MYFSISFSFNLLIYKEKSKKNIFKRKSSKLLKTGIKN